MRIWIDNGIIWFDPWWLVSLTIVIPYALVFGVALLWALWMDRGRPRSAEARTFRGANPAPKFSHSERR